MKQKDAADIKVGDTITFTRDSDGKSITHKVAEIRTDFGTGELRFVTKGVNNTSVDNELVAPKNVLGVVVCRIPALGAIMAAMSENIHLVLIMFGLCVALAIMLRILFGKERGHAARIRMV